jgi:hypothetical protein
MMTKGSTFFDRCECPQRKYRNYMISFHDAAEDIADAIIGFFTQGEK